MIGIAAITAALIVLLSAFNGIEKMIEELYSEYDTDITIRPKQGKTFNEQRIELSKILALDEVDDVCRVVEEVVILKHEKKWVNANLIGVDPSFLSITNMENHMVDGDPVLGKDGDDMAIIGATLLDKLDGYVPENIGYESVVCYVPKRKIKIRFGKNPFKTKVVKIAGRMNYNRDVNAQNFIVPLSLSREMLDYDSQLSALYVDVDPRESNESVKEKIQDLIGDDFVVKTNFEKNELIYKTSKSEKLIVLFILLFIFVLAAFNLVASLTMLFVEKLDNIRTMQSYGASKGFIFNIFFFEGLLISGKGILFGALFGYLVCWLQLQFGLLTMPNSGGQAFPIGISPADGVIIIGSVLVLSLLFSYFPVKYLIYKNVSRSN